MRTALVVALAFMGALARAETPPARQAAAVSAGLAELVRSAQRQQDELDGFVAELRAWKHARTAPPASIDEKAAGGFCRASPITVDSLDPRDLKTYYACKALAAGAEVSVCAPLPSQDDRSDCRGIMRDLALARSLISGAPDFEALCRQRAAELDLRVSPDILDAGCRGLTRTSSIEEHCREMIRRFPKDFPGMPQCLGKFGLYRGEGCGHYEDFDYQKVLCATIAAYRQAYAAKSAAACGAEYPCRLLMGEPGACEDGLGRLKDNYCAKPVSERKPPAAWLGVLRPQIEGALALAAAQPLDEAHQNAAGRLYLGMIGRVPLAPRETAADIFVIRLAQLDDLFARADTALALLDPARPGRREAQKTLTRLKARSRKAQKRYRSWDCAS